MNITEGIEIGTDIITEGLINLDVSPKTSLPNDRTWRIAVMGPANVGKTSMITQMMTGEFVNTYTPSAGQTSSIKYKGRVVEIVDTAGQIPDSPFPVVYAVNFDAYMIVYDTSSMDTYIQTVDLLRKLKDITGTNQMPTILIANKGDLEDDRDICSDEVHKEARREKIEYRRISAKNNGQVAEAFNNLIMTIEARHK
jgi:small GTP-binding protein